MTQPAVDVQTILSGELMRAARAGWVLENRGDSWATLRHDRLFLSSRRIVMRSARLVR
jgi:hypothetical protein